MHALLDTEAPGGVNADPFDGVSFRSKTTMLLRDEIVAGDFEPGSKLLIRDIGDRLCVSPNVVREALSALVAEQLVVQHDQRGFAVAPLSPVDLRELVALRCTIEALALERSIACADLQWEGHVVAAAHRLRRMSGLVEEKPGEIAYEWMACHDAFHDALISACDSPRILMTRAHFQTHSQRYRNVALRRRHSGRLDHDLPTILAFALARDSDGLIGAVLDHIRRTGAVAERTIFPDTEGSPAA